MSDVTDAQREIAGIVAEFHRKIRMRTGMVDAISRIVVSDGLSLALGIPRDGAIFGNVELVPDPGVRAAAVDALEVATPAVEWVDDDGFVTARFGSLSLEILNLAEGGWAWSVIIGGYRQAHGGDMTTTLDAAKAAAIAAARAWRDSIRL